MAHGKVSDTMPADCARVFAVLHDYPLRTTWDSLLSAAYLEGGATAAGKGVVSTCVGRKSLGGLALQTVYVSFDLGVVAAVKMINRPPFFATWAASIRHAPVEGGSTVTYTWTFTARPRWLAFLLEPVMAVVFKWETRKRLRALRKHLASV